MSDISFDEILENPGKFGAPTFEEFKRNTDKWLGRSDDKFAGVEKGSAILGRYVKRHVFELEGYRCKTLEEVERVASMQGIPLSELDYRAEIIPLGGGKCDILVKFMSKAERERRDGGQDASMGSRR